MSELREYMVKQYGGLRDDRSDESYALEFLRTANENLKLHQTRVRLMIAAKDLLHHLEWTKNLSTRCEQLVKDLAALEEKVKQETPCQPSKS